MSAANTITHTASASTCQLPITDVHDRNTRVAKVVLKGHEAGRTGILISTACFLHTAASVSVHQ